MRHATMRAWDRSVDPCVIVCEHQSMPERWGRAGATCVLASVGGPGGHSPLTLRPCDDLCVTFQTKSEIFFRPKKKGWGEVGVVY